jgi:hypothetical protein
MGLAVEEANLSSIVTYSGGRGPSQAGSPSGTQNIHHKMAVSLLLKMFTIGQSICYSKHLSQDGSLSAIYNIKKWQSACYSKHPQNGSLSATKNNNKMAVSLLLKTITKWQSLCYSKQSQNGSLSATQNNHKMAVSLLLKTLTSWDCLCYSEYSYFVFLNG